MINQTILFLPQTDCSDIKLKSYAGILGVNVNWNPDIHLGTPLSKIFNRVIRFEIGDSYCKDGVIQTNKRIVELVREHFPKYVIWPTMTYEILEETFQEIRKLGAYVIGWFFDDECRFDNYSRWWIPYMDYIFTADKASVLRYNEIGAKAFHLLVTGEPDDFNSLPANVSYNVSFVGSKFVGDREDLVKKLCSDGVPISTFGKGWDNGFVSNDEMIQIFSNSKINICFTKSCAGSRNQLKGKIFDITMCGGFLLCEYVEGIEDFFEIGKEIICFKNYAEALEKIQYYMINDEERELIAKTGKFRAICDLAQHKLLEKVFGDVEKDIEATTERIFMPVSVSQMPKHIRRSHAQYHLRWADVLKKEGFEKRFWRDEYDLACKYDRTFSKLNFECPKILRGFLIINKFKAQVRKKCVRLIGQVRKSRDLLSIYNRNLKYRILASKKFDFKNYSSKTINFIEILNTGSKFEYRYASSVSQPNIYGSIYASLINNLIHKNNYFSDKDTKEWVEYFDRFQREDGLFVDPVLECPHYYDLDWWGARHLSLHLIICYTYLGAKPRYEFNYIKKYYDHDILRQYLDSLEFDNIKSVDSDNTIMNLGSLLQYQRDFFDDKKAGETLLFLFEELEKKINPKTGSWGIGSDSDKEYISRAQQFAYHLYPLWLYDNREIKYKEKLIDLTLSLQNVFGGFSPMLNSSACEDIDAIDLLIKLSKLTDYRKEDIRKAMEKAFVWVLTNQNDDGGFVFRLNEPFVYGHPLTSSLKNESHLFATWFRTLSIAYLTDYLGIDNDFNVGHCPGLHFKMDYK